MATIAFIGLGNMGGPMAENCIKAGHSVRAFDLVESALQKLVGKGGEAASSAVEAVAGAHYVISMLPAGAHVASLYLDGDNRLLDHIDPQAVILDCSTIDVATVKKVSEAAVEKGLRFLDAPVSGGVVAAQAGTLTFMCGGTADNFELAKTALQAMGKNIFHAGDCGAGQVAKMCNNMLLAVHMIGTAEALQMGVNNGLDAKVLSDIMLASSGRNWSLEVYNPYPGVQPNVPSSNDYKPGFMGKLMAKDLGLAMENSVASNSSVPMGELAQSLYQRFNEAGNSDRDFSAIIELLQQN